MRTLVPINATRPPQDPAGYMTRPALLAAFIPLSNVKDARDEIDTALSSLKQSPGSVDFLKQVMTHCSRLVLHREFPEEKPTTLDKAAETIVRTLEHSGARTIYSCSPGKVDGFTNRFAALMKSINRYCENNAFNTDEGPDCFGTLCEILRSEKDGTVWSETSLKKHIRNAFNSLPEKNEEAQYAEVGTFTDCADRLLNSWEETHASWFEPGELSDKHCSSWIREDTSWREPKAPSLEAKESSQKPVKISQNQEPSWCKPDQSWRVYDASEAETYQRAEFDKTRKAIAAVQKGDPSNGHERRILHTATYCVLQHLLPGYDPRSLTSLARNLVKLLAYKQENTDLINALGDMQQGFRGQVNFAGLAQYINEKGIPGEQGGLKDAMGSTPVTSRPLLRYTLNSLAEWTSRLIEHCASGAGSDGFPLSGLIHPQERPAEPSAPQKALDRINAYHTMPQAAKNVARTIGHVAGMPGIQAVGETSAYEQHKEDWDFLIEKCLDNILTLAFAERQQDMKSSEPLIKAIKEVLGEEADGFLLRSIKEQAGRIRLNKDIVDAKNRLTARETTRNNAEKELKNDEESLRSISTKRPNPNALHYARESVSVSKNLVAHCNEGVSDAEQALEKAQKSLEEYDGMATGINFDALVKGDWRELKKKVRHIRDRAKQGVFRFSPNTSLGIELLGTLVPYFEQASSRLSAQILGGSAYAKTQSAINKMKEDSLVQAALFTAQSLPQGVRDAWKVRADIPLLPYEGMSESEQGKVRDEINNIRTITDFLAAPGPDKYDNAEAAVKSLDKLHDKNRFANSTQPYAATGAGPAIPAAQPPQTHDAKMASLNNFLLTGTEIPGAGLNLATPLKNVLATIDKALQFPTAEAAELMNNTCIPPVKPYINSNTVPSAFIPASSKNNLKVEALSRTDATGRANYYLAWGCSPSQKKELMARLGEMYHIYDENENRGSERVNRITDSKGWIWQPSQRPVGILRDIRPKVDPSNSTSTNYPANFPDGKIFFLELKSESGETLFEKAYIPWSSKKDGEWHYDVCNQIIADMQDLSADKRICIKGMTYENYMKKRPQFEGGPLRTSYLNFFFATKDSLVVDATWQFKTVDELSSTHQMDAQITHISNLIKNDKIGVGSEARQKILNVLSQIYPDDPLNLGDKVSVDIDDNTKAIMVMDRYLYENGIINKPVDLFGHDRSEWRDLLKDSRIRDYYRAEELQAWNSDETKRYSALLSSAGLSSIDISKIKPRTRVTLTFKDESQQLTKKFYYDIGHFLELLNSPNIFVHNNSNFISFNIDSTSEVRGKIRQYLFVKHPYLKGISETPLADRIVPPVGSSDGAERMPEFLIRRKRNIIDLPKFCKDYPRDSHYYGRVPVRAYGNEYWDKVEIAAKNKKPLLRSNKLIGCTELQRYKALMMQPLHKISITNKIDIHAPTLPEPIIISSTTPSNTTTTAGVAVKGPTFERNLEAFLSSITATLKDNENENINYEWVDSAIRQTLDSYKELLGKLLISSNEEVELLSLINNSNGLSFEISFNYGLAPNQFFTDKTTIRPVGETLSDYFANAASKLIERIKNKYDNEKKCFITCPERRIKFIDTKLVFPVIQRRVGGGDINISDKVYNRISEELRENGGDADASVTIRELALRKLGSNLRSTKTSDISSKQREVVKSYYNSKVKILKNMQSLILSSIPNQRVFLAKQFTSFLDLPENQWPVIASQIFRTTTTERKIVSLNSSPSIFTVYGGLTDSESEPGKTLVDMLYDKTFRYQGCLSSMDVAGDLAKKLKISPEYKNTTKIKEKLDLLFRNDFILHNDGLPNELKNPEISYKVFLKDAINKAVNDIRILEIEKLILSSPTVVEDLEKACGSIEKIDYYQQAAHSASIVADRMKNELLHRYNSDEFYPLEDDWQNYFQLVRKFVGFIPVVGNELSLLCDIIAGDSTSAAIDAMFCLLPFIPQGGNLGQIARIVEVSASSALALEGVIQAIRSKDQQALTLAFIGAGMTAHSNFKSGIQIAKHFSGEHVKTSYGVMTPSMLYGGQTVPAAEYNGHLSPVFDNHGELIPVLNPDGSPIYSTQIEGGKSNPVVKIHGEQIPVVWNRDSYVRAIYDSFSDTMMPAVRSPSGEWKIAMEHNGELVPAYRYGDKLAPTVMYEGELCPLTKFNEQWVLATRQGNELVPALPYDGESYKNGKSPNSWVAAMPADDGTAVPMVILNGEWVPAERYEDLWVPQSTDRYGRTGVITAPHGENEVILFGVKGNYEVVIKKGDEWFIAKKNGNEFVVDEQATVTNEDGVFRSCRRARGIQQEGTVGIITKSLDGSSKANHVPVIGWKPDTETPSSPLDPYHALATSFPDAYNEKIQNVPVSQRPDQMIANEDFALWFAERSSTISQQTSNGQAIPTASVNDADSGYALLRGRLMKVLAGQLKHEAIDSGVSVKYNKYFPVVVRAQQGIFYQVAMSNVSSQFKGKLYGGMVVVKDKTNKGRWHAVTAVEESSPDGTIDLKYYFGVTDRQQAKKASDVFSRGQIVAMKDESLYMTGQNRVLMNELKDLHIKCVLANNLAKIYGRDDFNSRLQRLDKMPAFKVRPKPYTTIITDTTPTQQDLFDSFNISELGEFNGDYYHKVIDTSFSPIKYNNYEKARKFINGIIKPQDVDFLGFGVEAENGIKNKAGSKWAESQSNAFSQKLKDNGVSLQTPEQKFRAKVHLSNSAQENYALAEVFARWDTTEASLSQGFDDFRETLHERIIIQEINHDFNYAEHPTGQHKSTIAVARLSDPRFSGITFRGVNGRFSDVVGLDFQPTRKYRHSSDSDSRVQRHAEEMIVNEVHQFAVRNKINPLSISGKMIVMLDNKSGVCNDCKAGLIVENRRLGAATKTSPLVAFSKDYKNLEIEFQVRKLEDVSLRNYDFSIRSGVRCR
ncbi:hypothetical protein GE278_23940 (plasmid) [Enterobacteriaceae bacterium Kacie_13]|nr:hypothetical protein GE278_23940 [Enterobacteriaceae bacterium Kacie_13]